MSSYTFTNDFLKQNNARIIDRKEDILKKLLNIATQNRRKWAEEAETLDNLDDHTAIVRQEGEKIDVPCKRYIA